MDPEDSQTKLRDRAKSCGDAPRTLFLPFSSQLQVSSSFKFHVFLLLQPFLNICYFTLITPFRFARSSKGTYILRVNPLQQVLSTILVLFAIIYALLDLRYWLEQNLKEKPQQAFRYASYLMRGFIPLLWGFTFWGKRKWFAKLLVACQGKKSGQNLLIGPKPTKRSVRPTWKLRLGVGIVVGLSISKVAYETCNWSSVDTLFLYNFQVSLYNLRQYDWDESGKEAKRLLLVGSIMTNGIVYTSTFLYVIDLYVEHMFDLLCFIGAAMVYAVCGHFSDEMEKLSRAGEDVDGDGPESSSNDLLQSKRILKAMRRNYVDLIAILDSINEVFGSLIVLYFLRSYPTLVWCVFGLFRKIELHYAFFYAHKIFIFVLVTVMAAEGNSNVGQFKRWLFRTSLASSSDDECQDEYQDSCDEAKIASANVDLAELNILHREVSTEKLGLKGYKFFTVTHGLIGTMLSVVVTYAIVMLQFEMDSEEAKRTTTTINGTGSVVPAATMMPYLRSMAELDIVNTTEQGLNEDIYQNGFKDVLDV